MKTKAARLCLFLLALSLTCGFNEIARGQAAGFFRIAGASTSGIISFNQNGSLVWSNGNPSTTYTLQRSSSLTADSNWVSYLVLPIAGIVNTNQIVDFNPPTGMSFIPAGSFTMGDTLDGESDAMPTNVYVSAFYMDTNLVTYSLWQTVYNWAITNGYNFDYSGSAKGTNHPPVQLLNWYDAVKWCNARSQRAALTLAYYTDVALTALYTNGDTSLVYVNWSANGYRLPTEAEWEKAARGGLSGQRFPWGLTISENQANYSASGSYSYDLSPRGPNTNFDTGGFPYTSPVGYFAPNGYGLYDMAGNVQEWCWDWYGTLYGQPTTNNPTGPISGSYRIVRGGSWFFDASVARCADRFVSDPDRPEGSYGFGFRCVRSH